MADSGGNRPDSSAIPVVIICGPTCSGKSDLAITVAQKFDAEIISADSRQIYRQLKIGTARLEPGDWEGIPHYFLGNVDLGERFTAYDFACKASNIIEKVHERGKRIVICGGTGLYIRALVDGIVELPDDKPMFRNELLELAATQGPEYVHRMLAEVDPEEAARIHPHNMIRVIRALELYQLTGRRKSKLSEMTFPKCRRLTASYIILNPPREKLYQLIEERVDRMMAAGLEAEARQIYESPLREELRRCKIVGYNELIEYFEGRYSLAEAVNLIKQDTRRYAKRQYTWFHRFKTGNVFDSFGQEASEISLKVVKGYWD
jgi:tRNA dimethylallyltransferase